MKYFFSQDEAASLIANGNWRMVFAFEGKDVVLVDYRDYH
jgi:proteic killer suppression protein